MSDLREKFYEQLARHLVKWRDAGVRAVNDPKTADWLEMPSAAQRLHAKGWTPQELEDLRSLLSECCGGILHSTLVTLDGGSALADTGNVKLIDEATGKELTEGALHEEFAEVLARKGLI
jgi:hypothetical protein